MKILLADDEVSIQKLISGLLEDEGHECVCVEDGTDALEAFENASFDLVILDVMMPRMDGFATCRELRTRGVTVPVIFLSAKGDIVDKGIGFAAGGDDYMTKPFDPRELLMHIEAHLRRAHMDVAPAKPEPKTLMLGRFVIDTANTRSQKRESQLSSRLRNLKSCLRLPTCPILCFRKNSSSKTLGVPNSSVKRKALRCS